MKYYVKQFPLIFKNNLYRLDENGVLLTKIPYSLEYHPSLEYITIYALENVENYMDVDCREKFLNQVNWLRNNIDEEGKWEQKFRLPYYNFGKSWISGMGQGLAISVLIRAYQLTADYNYLKTAKKAFKPFEKQIKDGGILYLDESKNVWIEECSVYPPPHTLNSFIYSLFGIYDLYKTTDSNDVAELWFKGVDTLRKNIKEYDSGYWSYHNLLTKHPAETMYHRIHIEQLEVLYKLTDKKIFKKYNDKFQEYLNSSSCMYKAKVNRGITHFKIHGTVGLIKRYVEKKRWQDE